MSSVLVASAILLTSCRGQNPTLDPDDVLDELADVNPTALMRSIFSFMSDDEFALLEPITSELSALDMHDSSAWGEYVNHSVWDAVYGAAEELCTELALSSESCYNDCINYNSIPSWIPLLTSNDTEELQQLFKMVKLYSVSAGPISWNDVGNVDMCEFFEGTYCYTPGYGGGIEVMQHACCVPGTCTGLDAIKVVSTNEWCYKSYHDLFAAASVTVFPVCEQMERDMESTSGWTTIVIFFIFLGCIIVASLLKRWCIEYGKVDLKVVDSNPFLRVFNIQSIWSAFGKTRAKAHSSMNFLDGIRVWSMTWVILGHSFLFYMPPYGLASNFMTFQGTRSDYEYLVQDFYLIFIQYAFYAVDTFFFLSGLLATLSMYRSIKKLGNRPLLYIPMSYLSRFLRLAPMMMFVTAIQWTLADQLPYGYHTLSRSFNHQFCGDNWYKILFFYANLTLTKTDSEGLYCMGHLWYIQCDMQMFLLLPFLLWMFTRDRVIGLIASVIPVVVSVGIRLFYAFYYGFVANAIVADPDHEVKHDGNQNNQSYFQPWTRMSVYFIAVALAMIMIMIDEMKSRKFVLSACQYWACMVAAAFILLSLVVWPYQDVEDLPDDRWNDLSNQFYYALGRPAWGVGLALLTFGWKYMDEDTENNGNGQKSMVKAFLSLEVWQPLGKLTYVMYLIHLIVFSWWVGDAETVNYYSEWNELLLIIGIWIIVMTIGVVLWFVIEKPLNNMVTLFMELITGKGGRRSKRMVEQRLLAEPEVHSPVVIASELYTEDKTADLEKRSSINSSNLMSTNRSDLEGTGYTNSKYN